MNNEKLSKKLAEWVGFTWYDEPCSYKGCSGHCGWRYPDGNTVQPLGMRGLPNFLSSLDACFKWLVPRLDLYEIIFSAKESVNGYVCQLVWHSKDPDRLGMHDHVTECGDTPALALCKAIEQLIDKEKE